MVQNAHQLESFSHSYHCTTRQTTANKSLAAGATEKRLGFVSIIAIVSGPRAVTKKK